MSIIVGALSRTVGGELPNELCASLRRALTRGATDDDPRVREYRRAGAFVAQLDLGVLSAVPAVASDVAGLTIVAGEPLLDTSRPRDAGAIGRDAARLHEIALAGRWAELSDARGTFCAVHLRPDRHTVCLVADAIGVRPLYYWLGERLVVFATALRVLEQVDEIPKRMDVRGVTELSRLGYTMGRRTPYAGISVLRSAEVVSLSPEGEAHESYLRWNQIPLSARPENELLRGAHERFMEAIALRLRGDRATAAFLSGGLDSRMVVAGLRALGVDVLTFGFSTPGLALPDAVLGAEYARAAGAVHTLVGLEPRAKPNWSLLMAEALQTEPAARGWPAERPRAVWSGDGGSVGVGHVYISPETVAHLRAGRRSAAIQRYLEGQGAFPVRRLFTRQAWGRIAEVLTEGVREELEALSDEEDPGRSFYAFLLMNDQRRHLVQHFEEMDAHRLELQLPFFDSTFLRTIAAVPLDSRLRHAFYLRWMALFPPSTTAVPWQSYPGHEPCPLPMPASLSYQWSAETRAQVTAVERRSLVRGARAMLGRRGSLWNLLDRRFLRLATWAHALGLRDFGYVLRAAEVYGRYAERSGGRYVLPD